uniref:Uncharacterized protein n=1 Tax=Arundo donax TaxID=35708 RepID=A0A0A9GP98_ARUDO
MRFTLQPVLRIWPKAAKPRSKRPTSQKQLIMMP